jgi:uncharacterized protein YcfJ
MTTRIHVNTTAGKGATPQTLIEVHRHTPATPKALLIAAATVFTLGALAGGIAGYNMGYRAERAAMTQQITTAGAVLTRDLQTEAQETGPTNNDAAEIKILKSAIASTPASNVAMKRDLTAELRGEQADNGIIPPASGS